MAKKADGDRGDSKKPMGEKSGHNKLDGDCTLPPDHPLPPDQLNRYSPDRDFYSEREIAEYVEGQARGEEIVQNVERIKTEYVMGTPYEIWDVITDKDRWWVITNPINLYSQKHFPSLDYTLSFHVGLMMRVMSRSAKQGDRAGSGCLNNFALEISGFLPGFLGRVDALLGCDAGRA